MTNEQGLVERYVARCKEMSEGGKYTWWSGLAAALEAQSAQIAELQAEVERWKQAAEDQQALRLRREADLKRALDTAQDRAAQNGRWLGELLAVIHRDGGHYQATHGDEKSVNDAHAVWASLQSALDTARHDAMEEAAKVADEYDGDLEEKCAANRISDAIRALQTKDQSHGA